MYSGVRLFIHLYVSAAIHLSLLNEELGARLSPAGWHSLM